MTTHGSDLLISGCAGFSIGAATMWYYFARARLLRTRGEWYADPAVAAQYPDEAARFLRDGHDF